MDVPSAMPICSYGRTCTALSGMPCLVIAATNTSTQATTLTVSWNCRNLRTESKTLRPHLYRYGLYSHGLHSYGLYSYGHDVNRGLELQEVADRAKDAAAPPVPPCSNI